MTWGLATLHPYTGEQHSFPVELTAMPLASSWAEVAAALGTLLAVVVALGLTAWEVRHARRDRESAAVTESELAARKVFGWVQASTEFEDGVPIGGQKRYLIHNGGEAPIFDVTVIDEGAQVCVVTAVTPQPAPQEVHRSPVPAGRLKWSDRRVRVTFVDVEGVLWERGRSGGLRSLGRVQFDGDFDD